MNIRRELIISLGMGLLAAPFASLAQQTGKVSHIGFLSPRSRPVNFNSDVYGAFLQRMRELGYIEGKNLVIEWRFAEGNYERLPGLAAELTQLKLDLIVALGTPSIEAAHKASATIPIVMANAVDPLGSGFVNSLTRPDGNITGLAILSSDVSPKHFEMLLSILPQLSRVGVLVHPDNSNNASVLKNIQAIAQGATVKIIAISARTLKEIENGFSVMDRANAQAVIIALDGFFIQHRNEIAELAARHKLPSIAGFREYAEAGGLMTYGQDLNNNYRQTATYVDKILKGVSPGDLPIGQPMKFELFVNARTAKGLGVKIPRSILQRADKIIE